MADVQALDMDVVTEKSGHSVVGMAVSVCLTPAAPAPLPMPYPLTASVSEGISDSPLRTKVSGTNCATIGSVLEDVPRQRAGLAQGGGQPEPDGAGGSRHRRVLRCSSSWGRQRSQGRSAT